MEIKLKLKDVLPLEFLGSEILGIQLPGQYAYRLMKVMRHMPGLEGVRLLRTAPTLGIRETRRIRGHYRLTLDDLSEALGHRFRTRSDTEVIVHAYEAWGSGCFERFNGQWALALWDSGAGRLVLSRDRIGVRPLYVREENGRVWFASEVKALFAVIKSLQSRGISILFVSHKLDEVFEISERYTILRNGENAAAGSTRDLGSAHPLPGYALGGSFLIVALTAWMAIAAHGATYYISTAGADSTSGAAADQAFPRPTRSPWPLDSSRGRASWASRWPSSAPTPARRSGCWR